MDYLAIYLNDHLLGSTVGRDLARRIAGRDDAYAAELVRVAAEIDEDRERLIALMERLDVGRDRLKTIAGWVGEKAARLKLNGHLLSLSPLSRMEELEMLSLGIEGKASLWRALRASGDPRLDPAELDELLERAEGQREHVEALRLRAAAETLGRAAGASPVPRA